MSRGTREKAKEGKGGELYGEKVISALGFYL